MKVEILYFSGCPNHVPAVDRVREVLQQEGTPADMVEVEVKDAATAQQVGFLGSPSIRVDGQDVEPSGAGGSRFRNDVPHLYRRRPACRRATSGMDSGGGAGSKGEIMRVTDKLTPMAAAMSALATLACCLPLGIAGAVGALGLSVALERLRPWLIGLAVILLGVSAFQMYRRGKSCQRRSRLSLVCFGLSAAIVLTVLIFPQQLAELLAGLH